jgi:hypothetical protein
MSYWGNPRRAFGLPQKEKVKGAQVALVGKMSSQAPVAWNTQKAKT